MASAIVYENVAEGADLATGELFEGKNFWVAQRVPHRTALLGVIKANGGSIVQLEKLADWMIADHFRKKCPAGSISYDFVHKSVAKGEILDPNDFPAGPRIGTVRDAGSMSRPAKGIRAPFTSEEDRILYKWAKDAQSRGAAVSGNKLYMALEEKHPQHTWQSWRDRYVKKLQYMPPSAFNIPDNAPPSPPSDHSSRVVEPPVVSKTVLVKNKDKPSVVLPEKQPTTIASTASKDQATSEVLHTNNMQAASREDYTIDQLAATFTSEDWEHIYAFVEEIDSCMKEDNSYDEAWVNFAESKNNQTVEQWRQYYEKVVRPQWLRDPASKRERIKKKIVETFADVSSSPVKSQSWPQIQDSAIAASQAGPSVSTNPPTSTVLNVLHSDSGLASEATAQQETPRYIRVGYEAAVKRIRGEVDEHQESNETSRPAKIRRAVSSSPTRAELEEPEELAGTQEQPLEISSAVGSQPGSPPQQNQTRSLQSQVQEQVAQAVDDDEDTNSIASDDDVELVTPLPRPTVAKDDDDLESVASSTDIVHLAPIPRPPLVPEDEDDDEDEDEDNDEDSLPPNSPTPRASRYAAFDTQAILSPSQAHHNIHALPRPDLSSSPPHHPDSDASTTQSLQEFSSYLQDPTQQRHLPPQPPSRIPRPASPTLSTTSTASSTGSEDPDPPLSAAEMDDYFSTQQRAGFSSAFISAALKRTRFRPRLATAVLEARRRGAGLPVQRGVWSVEEDEVVRRGDGRALEGLVERHTLDGWGGVTERVRFLEAWEGR